MTKEDRLDTVRLAWRLRLPTETLAHFDARIGEELGCSHRTVARLRKKIGARLEPRIIRPHLLAAMGSKP